MVSVRFCHLFTYLLETNMSWIELVMAICINHILSVFVGKKNTILKESKLWFVHKKYGQTWNYTAIVKQHKSTAAFHLNDACVSTVWLSRPSIATARYGIFLLLKGIWWTWLLESTSFKRLGIVQKKTSNAFY